MDIIIILIVLIALAQAALHWGVKSTDGINSPEWERRQCWFPTERACMVLHSYAQSIH
jgi:hypothetical protein